MFPHISVTPFPPQKLFDRAMPNKGGQALEVFGDLSGPEHYDTRAFVVSTYVAVAYCSLTKDRCFTYLRNYGAALITKFHVGEDFRLANKFSFTVSVVIDPYFEDDYLAGHGSRGYASG
jgi:hypothetical protein